MNKVLLFLLALLAASPAQGQDIGDIRLVRESDIQLTATREQELKKWLDDVRRYRDWYSRYRNRVVYGFMGGAGERKALPPVPDWLPGTCDLLNEFFPRPDGSLADGCEALIAYRSNFTVDPRQQQLLQARKQNELDPHSSFWKHLHLDLGWGSLDYRMQTYGLVGVHVTLPEIAKRVQIFLPPGFLLVSVPDGRGGREIQPAATIGVSIKMFQFQFPRDKPGMAYFNVAKAYFFNHATPMNTQSTVDLVGLSFSWGR